MSAFTHDPRSGIRSGSDELRPVPPPPGSPDDPALRAIRAPERPSQPASAAAVSPSPSFEFLAPEARTKKFLLAYPVRIGGVVLAALTIRRLSGRDVEAWANSSSTDLVDLYAVMTGQHPDSIRNLDADDRDGLVEAATDFLPRSLRGEVASGST